MARTYKRDSRGRFASGGGSSGSGGRPKARMQQRGTNRLTRDNAGRIQGIGGSGATARGGRLKTAAGNRRATQLDRLKGRIGGTVAKPRGLKPGAVKVKARPKSIKATSEQKAIASLLKKEVRSKNIQASRILMKMASKDGHGGDIKGLTSTVASNGRGGWRPVPTRNQRGNAMSASKNKELMFDRAPTRRLMKAAMAAADSGRVSQKRLDKVLKAAGMDYMTINQGYWRAVDKAKASLSRRRRR